MHALIIGSIFITS